MRQLTPLPPARLSCARWCKHCKTGHFWLPDHPENLRKVRYSRSNQDEFNLKSTIGHAVFEQLVCGLVSPLCALRIDRRAQANVPNLQWSDTPLLLAQDDVTGGSNSM